MASLTGVGDAVTLDVYGVNKQVLVSLSGTYAMTIAFQRSLGSGAWETIATYDTADATVADRSYSTRREYERLRIIVIADTSGTVVATLEEETNSTTQVWKADDGSTIAEMTEDYLSVHKGIYENPPLNLTATTVLDPNLHANRLVTLTPNGSADLVFTLPVPTGSGHRYKFALVNGVGSGSITFQIAGSNPLTIMRGVIQGLTDNSDNVVGWNAGSANDGVELNGTTKGGNIGDQLEFIDYASNAYLVSGQLLQTGVESTPFINTIT